VRTKVSRDIFYSARNNWVINAAAYNMLVNLSGLFGYTGGHVLGNFSVTKQKGEAGTGVSANIKDPVDGMKLYQVVLEFGGKVNPGGYTPYAMAAKQVMDNEVAPGRAWAVNGMGANVRTMEFPSAGGGRGKPMKMYLTPIISFGYGLMRGYSQANHQPYSSNGGWINPFRPSTSRRSMLPRVRSAAAIAW
jgi:hypothetical protein